MAKVIEQNTFGGIFTGRNKKSTNDAKFWHIPLFLTLLIGLLLLLRIWIIYQLAEMDALYPVVLMDINDMRRENMRLTDEILTKESYIEIIQESRREGFVSGTVYILFPDGIRVQAAF